MRKVQYAVAEQGSHRTVEAREQERTVVTVSSVAVYCTSVGVVNAAVGARKGGSEHARSDMRPRGCTLCAGPDVTTTSHVRSLGLSPLM